MLDELPHAALHPRARGRRGADRVPPDPPVAPRRGAVQLADVPVADAAAADAAQPARPSGSCSCCGRRRCACWRSRSPGRSCARRLDLDFGDVERRRIAVLIDTSASMRRGDLWPRAPSTGRQGHRRLPAHRSTRRVRLRSQTRPLLGFHESATLDPAQRRPSPGRWSIAWLRPGAGRTWARP